MKRCLILLLILALLAALLVPVCAASESVDYAFEEPMYWAHFNFEFSPFLVILTAPSGISPEFDLSFTGSSPSVTLTVNYSGALTVEDMTVMYVSDSGSSLPANPNSCFPGVATWTLVLPMEPGYLYGTTTNCVIASSVVPDAPEPADAVINFGVAPPKDDDTDRVINSIGEFFEYLGELFTSALESLGDFLLQGLKDLFIPSEEFFAEKIDPLLGYFTWYKEVIELADELVTSLDQQTFALEAPSFTFTLSAPDSYWFEHMGEIEVVVDFAWYEQYKPMVDDILSGFIILAFIWRLFMAAPGIIAGEGSVSPVFTSTSPSTSAPDYSHWPAHDPPSLPSGRSKK